MIRLFLTSAVLSLYALTFGYVLAFGARNTAGTCFFDCPGSQTSHSNGCCEALPGGGSTVVIDSRHVSNHELTCCPAEENHMGRSEKSDNEFPDSDQPFCRCALKTKNAFHEPPAQIRIAKAFDNIGVVSIHNAESAVKARHAKPSDSNSLPQSISLMHRCLVLIM
jgi:hypothetical protein